MNNQKGGNMKNLYWHFLPDDGRLQFGSKELVRVKHALILSPETKIVPCNIGFHASKRAIDALQYALGALVCRVTLHGNIVPHGDPVDKYAAHGRTVIWMADATETLRHFARLCALDVIHLWDAPQIVRDFLETGDENIRNAARNAAWAAWDAAWAARNAAWAARDAAGAAWDAAWAAWDAAWAAQNSRLTAMLEKRATKEELSWHDGIIM